MAFLRMRVLSHLHSRINSTDDTLRLMHCRRQLLLARVQLEGQPAAEPLPLGIRHVSRARHAIILKV